ncbi:MAG: hypothetical protein ABWY68_05905 [Cryobacterium sp.]
MEIYGLYRADGHGNKVEGAEKVDKKCCSYHRNQFLENGMWVVVSNRQIAKKPSDRPRYPSTGEFAEPPRPALEGEVA